MSETKYVVSRKVGKIDEVLSYVGGLFSTIIAFLAFFLQSFNEYRYELRVAEGVFVYDETGRRINEEDFYFWTRE